MKKNRVVALRAFPAHHNYLLNRVVFGKFMDEVTERRIPLLLSLEKAGGSWAAIYQLLTEFPNLTRKYLKKIKKRGLSPLLHALKGFRLFISSLPGTL